MVRGTWLDVNVVCHIDQSNQRQQEARHQPSSLSCRIPDYTDRRLEVSDPSFTLVPKFKTFLSPDADIFISTP